MKLYTESNLLKETASKKSIKILCGRRDRGSRGFTLCTIGFSSRAALMLQHYALIRKWLYVDVMKQIKNIYDGLKELIRGG